MNWQFLSVERIKETQAQLIHDFGGAHGLRDEGLLESAVVRAENKINYEPGVSVAEVAASISYGLIKNHAFIDGNKRIGFAALDLFLRLNGHALSVPNAEVKEWVLRVAASKTTEAEWTAWVVEHAREIR